MEQKTMAATMAPTMAPTMPIKIFPEILPLQKAVLQKLNDRSNGKPLRVLSEEDWKFWITQWLYRN